jgi:polysaccharide export outer membrane protein
MRSVRSSELKKRLELLGTKLIDELALCNTSLRSLQNHWNSGCASARAALESVIPMERVPNLLFRLLTLAVVSAVFGFPQVAVAQNSSPSQDLSYQGDPAHQQDTSKEPLAPPAQPPAAAEKTSPTEATSSALVLGPGDELEITVYGATDLSGHTRVSADGNISIPLIGYVRVAGLSSSEAEAAIEAQLRQNNIVNDPQVSVYAKQYTNGGVSVVGEVVRPGSYSTLGPHRLFDILQAAGGLTEKAANRAVISHRGSENPVTVELAKDPAKMAQSNVEVQPGDTVVVPAAPIVYVLGEVNKPGGYVLNSTNGVTLLRVVAAAGGPTHDAAVGRTRMLRSTSSGLKELQVPLKDILKAKAPDMPVQTDDIIFLPRSRAKAALSPGVLLNSALALAIYRIP